MSFLSSVVNGGEDFLSEHWKRPISPQNQNFTFNPTVSPFEKGGIIGGLSLYPEACGECHKEQYIGWKSSLHSKAVGPGLIGQIKPDKDPQFAESCYFCHAPMEEQAEMKGQEEYIKNPSFDKRLKLSGISCAVCHMREGKIYGPPAPHPSLSLKGRGGKSEIKDNHNGFIEKDFFEKAEFCAACHQLDEGYELNGKILVNTYREWKGSVYGKNNIICQSCHMPDRRHLWRGIHDREMVLKGISIETIRHKDGARLVITNTGAGHFFPTYTTPLVVIKGFRVDREERPIPSSVKQTYIGRKVNLDLTQEIFDTRIPPQKKIEFDYDMNDYYNNDKIVFEIWVHPDEFYNRFYSALLKSENMDIDRKAIEKALKATKDSGYRLFRKIL